MRVAILLVGGLELGPMSASATTPPSKINSRVKKNVHEVRLLGNGLTEVKRLPVNPGSPAPGSGLGGFCACARLSEIDRIAPAGWVHPEGVGRRQHTLWPTTRSESKSLPSPTTWLRASALLLACTCLSMGFASGGAWV